MTMITIKEYAAMHGRAEVTARQMARRGGLRTALKQGRDWMVDSEEPYPDRRRRMREALTREGRESLDAQQRRHELRIAQIRQYSIKTGPYGDTFTACLQAMPSELLDDLTPEQAGRTVDIVHEAYQAGRRHPDSTGRRTYAACLQLIPDGLLDTLTPDQGESMVAMVHRVYTDGQRRPDYEWLAADGE